MHIRVNGKSVELDTPLSLSELLQNYGITLSTGRLAVAFNERIAFRQEWDFIVLKDGDRVEIIHAIQGG